MQLALIGTGRMGSAVAALAEERGHEIVARFDEHRPFSEAASRSDLQGADVAIDFSLPGVALGHIEQCCRWQQPLVVGTTGWYDDIDLVRQWVESYHGSVLYASNFSMGIALLVKALRGLAPLLDHLPDYDVFVHEVHHIHKADSPSGTALTLAEALLDGLSRKTHIETETQHGRIDPEALHVSSSRAGQVFGTHTVGIDGPFDRITLTHDAKSRQGFADGALQAAAWLHRQQGRTGLFTLDDVFTDWLAQRTAPALAS